MHPETQEAEGPLVIISKAVFSRSKYAQLPQDH